MLHPKITLLFASIAEAALKQGFSILLMLLVSAGLAYLLQLEKLTREKQVAELTKEIRDCQSTIVTYYREERQLTLEVIRKNTEVLDDIRLEMQVKKRR
jgi:hypothetical protein